MGNMKNTYLAAGVVILVAVLGFILVSKKTEAPLQQVETSNDNIVSFSDGLYELDTSASAVSWEGEFLTGVSEKGTIGFKSGEFKVSQGFATSGEFVIDLNTIDSIPHKDRLVSHLKSDDFFGVASNPTAKFVLKKMVPSSEEGMRDGRYVFAGDLTIKGITEPISFTAVVTPENENTLKATASFAINRADWEIKYNSPTFFSNLGDKIIRDAVVIGLDLKAQKVIQ